MSVCHLILIIKLILYIQQELQFLRKADRKGERYLLSSGNLECQEIGVHTAEWSAWLHTQNFRDSQKFYSMSQSQRTMFMVIKKVWHSYYIHYITEINGKHIFKHQMNQLEGTANPQGNVLSLYQIKYHFKMFSCKYSPRSALSIFGHQRQSC